MKVRLVILSILAVAAATAVAAGDDAPKCSASARECEREIRQMLSGRRYLGVQVIDLKPGVEIKAVNNDGPAAHVNLEAGDRIIAVNGRPMTKASAREFKTVVGETRESGGLLFMIIERGSNYRKVEVRLAPYPKEQIDKIVAAHLAQSHSASAGSP